MLARHIGKYIPGNPTLIVQNMPGAGGLTASNWFEDLAKPDGLTVYYCVGSTAVTQQAFGLEGVKYNLRSWKMLGSVDQATSVVLLRPDKMERLTAKDQPPLGIGARTGDDAWSTIFLWGAESLTGTCVGFWAIKAAASCGSPSSVARPTFTPPPTCLPCAS